MPTYGTLSRNMSLIPSQQPALPLIPEPQEESRLAYLIQSVQGGSLQIPFLIKYLVDAKFSENELFERTPNGLGLTPLGHATATRFSDK